MVTQTTVMSTIAVVPLVGDCNISELTALMGCESSMPGGVSVPLSIRLGGWETGTGAGYRSNSMEVDVRDIFGRVESVQGRTDALQIFEAYFIYT